MLVNRSELARILDVSATTLDRRVEEGLPARVRPKRGERSEWQFDTAEVIEWLVQNGTPKPRPDLRQEANVRIAMANAGLKELELGRLQKVLVHVDDVAEVVNEQFAVIKSGFLALPARLAHELAAESDPEVCRQMLQAEVYEILEVIGGTEIPHPPEDLE